MSSPPALSLRPCACGAPAEHDTRRWNGRDPVHQNCGHAIYCSGPCPLPAVGGVPSFEEFEEAEAWWNEGGYRMILEMVDAG
jgi:hypothetical protein